MYLDANNLDGWATSQYPPTGNFKWMTEKQINNLDFLAYQNIKKIVKKVCYLKLISNIQMNYMICIMIILLLLKKLKLQNLCYLIMPKIFVRYLMYQLV